MELKMIRLGTAPVLINLAVLSEDYVDAEVQLKFRDGLCLQCHSIIESKRKPLEMHATPTTQCLSCVRAMSADRLALKT